MQVRNEQPRHARPGLLPRPQARPSHQRGSPANESQLTTLSEVGNVMELFLAFFSFVLRLRVRRGGQVARKLLLPSNLWDYPLPIDKLRQSMDSG